MAAPAAWNATRSTPAHGPAIADPTGGTPDVEGRAAVVPMLAAMRSANLIVGGGVSVAPTVLDAGRNALVHGAAIANPTGGAVVDAQARTAINAALVVLRDTYVIAGVATPGGPPITDEDDLTIKHSLAVVDPTGGATIDTQLRTAVNAILAALRSANAIALD